MQRRQAATFIESFFTSESPLSAKEACNLQGLHSIMHRWSKCACLCIKEVTPRIYRLFQQSPWWHHYTASQPEPEDYFTALLYRKDVFKPAGSFQVHPFTNSIMGKHSIPSVYASCHGPMLTPYLCLVFFFVLESGLAVYAHLQIRSQRDLTFSVHNCN